jgi:predicted nucleotidyltransferase
MKSAGKREWNVIRYDLKQFVGAATKRFKLDGIYLFGSRRFKTRSRRSDVDILLETSSHIRPADLREFVVEECVALDLFVLQHGRATSAVNESFLEFPDNAALLASTQAVRLWSKDCEISDDPALEWVQEYRDHIEFHMSGLPSIPLPMSVERLRDRLAGMNLPTDPIIGFPNWLGQTQPRVVKIEGDVLHLSTATPFRSGGKETNSYLSWKRVEPNT